MNLKEEIEKLSPGIVLRERHNDSYQTTIVYDLNGETLECSYYPNYHLCEIMVFGPGYYHRCHSGFGAANELPALFLEVIQNSWPYLPYFTTDGQQRIKFMLSQAAKNGTLPTLLAQAVRYIPVHVLDENLLGLINDHDRLRIIGNMYIAEAIR